MNQQADQTKFIHVAAEIVSAYVSNNHVQPADLTRLINDVHGALKSAETLASGEPAKPETPKATSQDIKRSITPDRLVSFEDGKGYRTLRRHLSIRGLTPQAYREKWGLPLDYPMAAPSYSKQRSDLAKALGLGQKRRAAPATSASDDVAPAAAVAETDATRPERQPKRAAAPRARKRAA